MKKSPYIVIHLAKNNNFLLRYKSVRDHNDDFIMVILFREPLAHASSLMEKHHEYRALQKEDPFVLEYMNWLGHHEFGENQLTFLFGEAEESIREDRDSLDFWLKIWINYYSHVLTTSHPNTLRINYEFYCKNPNETIKAILGKKGISSDHTDYKPFPGRRKADSGFSAYIYKTAQEVYAQLNRDSFPS